MWCGDIVLRIFNYETHCDILCSTSASLNETFACCRLRLNTQKKVSVLFVMRVYFNSSSSENFNLVREKRKFSSSSLIIVIASDDELRFSQKFRGKISNMLLVNWEKNIVIPRKKIMKKILILFQKFKDSNL